MSPAPPLTHGPEVRALLVAKACTRPAATSEDDLAEQMLACIETYNQTAKPFKWTYAGIGLREVRPSTPTVPPAPEEEQ